jgi:predicted tellurium resistance membrane protein TerC
MTIINMTEAIIPLLSLIALEVILGIDNIIFISILADKLPAHQRDKLRFWGIGLAHYCPTVNRTNSTVSGDSSNPHRYQSL